MRIIFSFLFVFEIFVFASNVSLEKMISQMIMVGFIGDDANDKWVNQIKRDISKDRISGVIIQEKNVKSKSSLIALIKKIKEQKGKIEPLIAVDFEKDKIFVNEKGFYEFPTQKEIAKEKSIDGAKKFYTKVAIRIRKMGINYVFSPLVNTIPTSSIHNSRAFNIFSSVSNSYAEAFLEAFNSKKVATAVKYFPGFPENKYVVKNWNFDELRVFYNFTKSNQAKSIEVANAYLKQFDKKYPAVMSKSILGILRNEIKYKNVVISDDLMDTTLGNFSIDERIIKSINSGVDILVFSKYFLNNTNTPKAVKTIVLKAVNNGKIKKSRIKEAYERIVKFKKELK